MLPILLVAFIVVTAIQLLLYFSLFSRFALAKESPRNDTHLHPISVIICAKNEAENLKNFLPKVMSQTYPIFEVVLINDASSDETQNIMEDFATKHPKIKLVNVANNEAFWGNKKYALTLGIKAAKYDHLVFTDADCVPNSAHWIETMSTRFTNEKTIVLGYGPYAKVKNSLTNKLVRFETFITALHYFSFAKAGIPFMGVGRNLAYHRSEFFGANGFIKHLHVKSGDDDLFINEVANKTNTAIVFNEDSYTISPAPQSFLQWFRQKRRHVATARHYQVKHQFLLGLNYTLQVLFWALLLILLSFLNQWMLVTAVLSFKLVIQYSIYLTAAKKLHCTRLLIFLPLLELFLVLFQFGIFIANSISKPTHWK
jgi:glycosyltransferase involved in cell wall biosynthesis